MWAELLPTFIGGTLTDHEAPQQPTEIVGFSLTDHQVFIIGRAFDFGGNRRYIGVGPSETKPGAFHIYTSFGLDATVEPPAEKAKE